MKLYTYCIFMIVLSFFSCNNKTSLEVALSNASKNKKELQRVLDKYSVNTSDSLKLKAAEFLISNMVDKVYLDGDRLTEFHEFIDTVYKIRSKIYHEQDYYQPFLNNSIYQRQKLEEFSDIKILSADFLIENIEEAFKVWNNPWAKHLNFEQFCELILPYRIGNELPESWRKLYASHFGHVLSDTVQTAIEACTKINNELIKYPIHIVHTSIRPADIKASSLLNMKFGLCEEYAALAAYSMRAQGIPVAIETIPAFGKGRAKHTFNVVLNNDGNYYNFSGAEQNPEDFHLQRFKAIPKIYRYTFGIQKESLALNCQEEPIPYFFQNPCLMDVTSNYDFIPVTNFTTEIDIKNMNGKKFAYLCVFGIEGWRAVDWAKIIGNKVSFKNVGGGIIYQIAFYHNARMQPVGYPFKLNETGEINYLIPDTKTKNDLCLTRKYPPAIHLSRIPETMLGSKFQAADKSDFSDAVDIYKLDTLPSFNYTTIVTRLNKPYKYYRFLASNTSSVNISEIEFYEKSTDNLVTGKVFGYEKQSIYYPSSTPDKAFDGDPLTFSHSEKKGQYIGLALNKPVIVDKIRYIIRNDDNGIRKNREYELFYADNGKWISAGKKIANTDDTILFENMPAGALYWLRNLTKGQEERIFLYKDGQQEWW